MTWNLANKGQRTINRACRLVTVCESFVSAASGEAAFPDCPAQTQKERRRQEGNSESATRIMTASLPDPRQMVRARSRPEALDIERNTGPR